MTLPSASPDGGPHPEVDNRSPTPRERREAAVCIAVLLVVLIAGAAATITRGPLGADAVWPGILIVAYVVSHTLGRARALHSSRS
jgi:hypothetical protein